MPLTPEFIKGVKKMMSSNKKQHDRMVGVVMAKAASSKNKNTHIKGKPKQSNGHY